MMVPSEVVTTFFKANVLWNTSLVRSTGESKSSCFLHYGRTRRKPTEVKRSGVSRGGGPSDGGWTLGTDDRSRLVELQGRNGRNEEEEGTATTGFNSSRSLKPREVSSGLTRALGTLQKVSCP